MAIFDKIKVPIFLKDSSEAKKQLLELKEIRENVSDSLADELEQEIAKVEAGIYGENAVKYELENSHIPMIVLHDVFLEFEGLTAQIDYIIITRKHHFVIECKNLVGDIEINSSGDFIRTTSYGRKTKKEGIYSPITQNRRHLELIKAMLKSRQSSFLQKMAFEKNFDNIYRSVVVLSNPKTILNDRYAKKEIKSQVIRADRLAEYIRKIDSDPNSTSFSEKDMQMYGDFFLKNHQPPKVDYVEKFRSLADEKAPQMDKEAKIQPNSENTEVSILCPKCKAPMVLRVSKKGANIGKEFYGCSNFPKCRGIVDIQE